MKTDRPFAPLAHAWSTLDASDLPVDSLAKRCFHAAFMAGATAAIVATTRLVGSRLELRDQREILDVLAELKAFATDQHDA